MTAEYGVVIFESKVVKLSKDRYGIYIPRKMSDDLSFLHGKEVIVHVYFRKKEEEG